MVVDLPAGGRRLMQKARGYRATVKAGQVTYRDGASRRTEGLCPGRAGRDRRPRELAADPPVGRYLFQLSAKRRGWQAPQESLTAFTAVAKASASFACAAFRPASAAATKSAAAFSNPARSS